MPTRAFKYTSYAISIIQKLVGANFTVTGLDNIPKDQPAMFVSNHFTRMETFLVPYLINKYTKRQVRSLAASILFSGFLGKFLRNLGTISTSDPNRNKTIICDLVNNKYDWLIYPEGGMVKNKNITKKQLYVSQTTAAISPVKTGSAVLALQSQLYRRDIVDAKKSSNDELLKNFEDEHGCIYDESLEKYTTFIVPLTVSYYPLRPGKNFLETFTKKRISNLPASISEELQIEGNLLSGSNINLHFGKPINLAEYIKVKRAIVYQIPIIKNKLKSNIITKYFKHILTTDFMTMVYKNLNINLDHVFCAAIRYSFDNEKTLTIPKLKRIIFLSAHLIRKTKRFKTENSLKGNNILKIFSDEKNVQFDSIFNLAIKLGDITLLKGGKIKINRSNITRENNFHFARVNNTLQVIFNEFQVLEYAASIVKRVADMSDKNLKTRVKGVLILQDRDRYEDEYKKYQGHKLSKSIGYGKPFFATPTLLQKNKNKNFSILLCHGYKSSPREMLDLSKFLNSCGFSTYCTRLSGHGTHPKNIKDVTWQDWDNSFQIAYSILKNVTENVIVIGFSTGGLISLLNASRKNSALAAVIAINPAIRLRDIRSHFVSTIDKWNNLLGKFNISKGVMEYVESTPENPKTNYVRNYLEGVIELKKLMEECDKSLEKIVTPVLLIQASGDPVVNPQGSTLIYNKIKSRKKVLLTPDFDNHVIINGSGKRGVFKMIIDFLKKEKFL